MEYYDSEERYTPDSCSTSDLGSQKELVLLSQHPSARLKLSKHKKLIQCFFSALKSQFEHHLTDPFELKSLINSEFLYESCEKLVEKFEFRCCENDEHSLHCEKKWNRIRKELLKKVDEELQEAKPVFIVKKRKEKVSSVLLNSSQPFWIHRLLVQSLFILSNN